MTHIDDKDIVEAEIAIVLTDIIGSTKFVEKNGNHFAAKWFKVHDRYCISQITKHNGVLCDASDGFLMYFGTVQDAIAFSIDYKRALKKHKFPFKSRVGIHWDTMLIVKTPENLVRANHKRISLEGIGKNIAARTMSICADNQILISYNAYQKYKQRTSSHRMIPNNTLIACVGLYSFKGVKNPEQIYAIGFEQAHLQPPPDGEKAKRIAGKNKIKTRLRNKKIKELIVWFINKLCFLSVVYTLIILAPFLANSEAKKFWGVDFAIFKPFEYIKALYLFVIGG